MHIVGSCSFSVPDRKSYRFEWKDYGIILQVQEGTVTDGNPVQLHISVCLSGQLNIPSEFDLVSAVYHISSSGKPAKPVYLEIQHCANIRNKKDLTCLTFVGAHSTGSLPYNFRSLKGIEECFSECSTYGLISLPSAQHGLVAIARQRVKRSSLISLLHLSTEVTCKYRLHVFYAAGEESEWIAHLVITRDHKPLLKVSGRHTLQVLSCVNIAIVCSTLMLCIKLHISTIQHRKITHRLWTCIKIDPPQ